MRIASTLLEPMICGEDLAETASRAAELAPVLCTGCADYHIWFAASRFVAPSGKSIAVDRPILIARIREILENGCSADRDIDIIIAGAADTGILATCAHAAALLGKSFLSRCRFTVLDLCRTPLTLCAEFAERHELRLTTMQCDLSEIAERLDADLIIAHSFLRFIDRPMQAMLLKRFADWLKPQGRMVISQSLRRTDETHHEKEVAKIEASLALIRSAMAEGTLPSSVGRLFDRNASPHAHLDQPGEIASLEDFRTLLAQAGLHEYSMDALVKEILLSGQQKFERSRVVAVLGASPTPLAFR